MASTQKFIQETFFVPDMKFLLKIYLP